jgi:hypothetical protein
MIARLEAIIRAVCSSIWRATFAREETTGSIGTPALA